MHVLRGVSFEDGTDGMHSWGIEGRAVFILLHDI